MGGFFEPHAIRRIGTKAPSKFIRASILKKQADELAFLFAKNHFDLASFMAIYWRYRVDYWRNCQLFADRSAGSAAIEVGMTAAKIANREVLSAECRVLSRRRRWRQQKKAAAMAAGNCYLFCVVVGNGLHLIVKLKHGSTTLSGGRFLREKSGV